MKDEGGTLDLRVRTKAFALRIIRVFGALPRTIEAQVIGKQVLRSGTSVGAHYREACRARSDAEFVSKIEGGLQELEETCYWLELLVESGIVKDEGGRMRHEGRADSSFSPQPSSFSFTVFFVDDNALAACFDTGINETLVKELAGYEPLRVVFRDNGFVSDAVRINVEQIFRQLSPGTEVKSL